ncbi:hypothetical protein GGR56DRAFT_676459 [Xylariaceae sp. FL0804]|nr:hypothetical protein GGR56DRAFT_676459 [Xylariaceae sp. FL0804]
MPVNKGKTTAVLTVTAFDGEEFDYGQPLTVTPQEMELRRKNPALNRGMIQKFIEAAKHLIEDVEAGEEAGLDGPEEQAAGDQAPEALHEARAEGQDAPGERDERDPPLRREELQDETRGSEGPAVAVALEYEHTLQQIEIAVLEYELSRIDAVMAYIERKAVESVWIWGSTAATPNTMMDEMAAYAEAVKKGMAEVNETLAAVLAELTAAAAEA